MDRAYTAGKVPGQKETKCATGFDKHDFGQMTLFPLSVPLQLRSGEYIIFGQLMCRRCALFELYRYEK